jgi:hypothetical protein
VAAAIGSGLLAAVLLAGFASDDGPDAASESTADAGSETDSETNTGSDSDSDSENTDSDTTPELAPPTVIDLTGTRHPPPNRSSAPTDPAAPPKR